MSQGFVGSTPTVVGSLTAGTTNQTLGGVSFANSNNVSFGLNAGTITASVNSQSAQPVAVSGSNGSFNFSTLSLGSSNSIHFYSTNGSIVASYAHPNPALSGSNGSFTYQTATFGNLNGASFYTTNGSMALSYTVPTQSVQPVAISASNGSFNFSTVTFGNSNGLSFYTTNGSVVGSYTVPAAGAVNFSAGTTSDNLNSVVFADSNGLSFGLNGSTITASHDGITTQTVQPVAISGSNGSFAFSTVTFGNLNGASFYTSNGSVVASYTVPSVTNSSWTLSAGTTDATVSALSLADSNGISFGLNNGTITASHNGITAQTVQPVALSGSNGSFNFSTATFGNLNGASFYTSNNSMVMSYTVPTVTNSSWTVEAGTSSESVSYLSFKDTNGISFGLDNGTITASHDGITSQSVQPIALSGSNGSFTYDTATFGNLNGASFYTTNGSMVLSYTVPTVTNSKWSLSAGTSSMTVDKLTFSDSNGISFGLNGSVVTASHNGLTAQTVQPVAASGSNGSFNFSTLSFGSSNSIHFYSTNGSLVGSYAHPNPAISGSNGSFTYQTVTFGNLNGLSFYTSNGSVVGSYTVPAAGGALSFSAGTTSNTFQSLVFSNLNNVSFGLNGSTVSGSAAIVITAGTSTATRSDFSFRNLNNVSFGMQGATITGSVIPVPAFSASNGSSGPLSTLSFGNSNGHSFYWTNSSLVVSYDHTNQALSGSNGSFTFQTATFGNLNGATFYTSNGSMVLSYTVPAAGAVNFSAGTTSNNLSSVVFNDANNVSFGLNGSTITATATFNQTFPTLQFWDNMQWWGGSASANIGSAGTVQAQVYVFPLGVIDGNMTVKTLMFDMSHSASGNSSSAPKVFTVRFGLYTLNGSTLSILNSVSAVYSIAANANNSTAYSGQRWIHFASTDWSASPVISAHQEYFGAFFYSSGGNNSAAQTAGFLGYFPFSTAVRSGVMNVSQTTANSLGFHPWIGVHATSSALPSSINMADLNKRGASSNFVPHIVFNNLSSYY